MQGNHTSCAVKIIAFTKLRWQQCTLGQQRTVQGKLAHHGQWRGRLNEGLATVTPAEGTCSMDDRSGNVLVLRRSLLIVNLRILLCIPEQSINGYVK